MNTYTVRTFQNDDADFIRPFQLGDRLTEGATLTVQADDEKGACEAAYAIGNGYGDPAQRDLWQRRRSMSIGDVAVVNGHAYTVAMIGFEYVADLTPYMLSKSAVVKCQHPKHDVDPESGFIFCPDCRTILCDCGKGNYCPQYGKLFGQRGLAHRAFAESIDELIERSLQAGAMKARLDNRERRGWKTDRTVFDGHMSRVAELRESLILADAESR